MPEHIMNSSRTDFISWRTARYRLTMDGSNFNLPSYIATKSLVSSFEIIPTLCTFTAIIPYAATQFDTIFTCTKNFQDVLLQMDSYGPTRPSIELPERYNYCDLKNLTTYFLVQVVFIWKKLF